MNGTVTDRISHLVTVFASQRHAGGMVGCAGCEVEGLCGGGCMAQSHAATGSIACKPHDDFCLLMRATFRSSVRRHLDAAPAT